MNETETTNSLHLSLLDWIYQINLTAFGWKNANLVFGVRVDGSESI